MKKQYQIRLIIIIALFLILNIFGVLSEEVNFGVGDSVKVTVIRYQNQTNISKNNYIQVNDNFNIIDKTEVKQENYIINKINEFNNKVEEKYKFNWIKIFWIIIGVIFILLIILLIYLFLYKKKTKIYIIPLCIIIAIIYIFLINIISSLITTNINTNIMTNEIIKDSGGNNVKLGVSDDISITVKRNRWYGQITEEDGIKILYLFNIIKIPLQVGSFNFIWIHTIVFIVLISLPIKILIIDKRRLKKYEMVD